MASAKGGTYAGQYSCDGWVDYREPTLLRPMTMEPRCCQNPKTLTRVEPSRADNGMLL